MWTSALRCSERMSGCGCPRTAKPAVSGQAPVAKRRELDRQVVRQADLGVVATMIRRHMDTLVANEIERYQVCQICRSFNLMSSQMFLHNYYLIIHHQRLKLINICRSYLAVATPTPSVHLGVSSRSPTCGPAPTWLLLRPGYFQYRKQRCSFAAFTRSSCCSWPFASPCNRCS